MKGAFRSRWLPPALTTLLFLFLVGLDAFYFIAENRPPDWDEAGHLKTVFTHYATFAGHPGSAWKALPWLTWYPPGVYVLVQPFLFLLGPTVRNAYLAISVLTNGLFIFSLFGLGRRLAPPDEEGSGRHRNAAGLLAALVGALAPGLYVFSRTFLLDAPLMAVTAFALYAAVRFAARPAASTSLLLTFALVLGLMTKWTFPIFIGPPLLLWLFFPPGEASTESSEKRDGLRRRFVLLGWIALAVLLITGPYYYKLLPAMQKGFSFGESQAREFEMPPVLSPSSLGRYLRDLYYYQLTPALFWLVVLSAPGLVKTSRVSAPLAAGVAVPYVFFTLLRNKVIRYTLPLLPALVALTALGLTRMLFYKRLSRPLRLAYRGAVVLLLGFALFQLLATSLYRTLPPAVAAETERVFPPWHFLRYWYRSREADNDDLRALMEAILADLPEGAEGPVTVLTLTNRAGLNAATLSFMAHTWGMPLEFMGPDQLESVEDRVNSYEIQYFLTDSRSQKKVYYLRDRIAEAEKLIREQRDKYKLVCRRVLKDDTELEVLRRTEPVEAFTLGKEPLTIEFDNDRITRRCLGFQYVEVWDGDQTVMWSRGKKTEIPFRAAPDEGGKPPGVEIWVRASALPEETRTTRSVKVLFNGLTVRRLEIGNPWSEFQIRIPAGLVSDGVNILTFEYGEPVQPCLSRAVSTDCRELAVVFDRLVFRAVPEEKAGDAGETAP